MKFIRDIINEQKLSSEAEGLFQSAAQAGSDNLRTEEEPGDLAPLDLGAFGSVAGDCAETVDFEQDHSLSHPEEDASTDCFAPEMNVPEADEPDAVVDDMPEPVPNVFAETETADVCDPELNAPHPEESEGAGSDLSFEEVAPREPVAEIPAAPSDQPEPAPASVVVPVAVPKPAAGRTANRSGRVKTRLLGFSGSESASSDPFGQIGTSATSEFTNFPVGWLVVTSGPGRGAAFSLFEGLTQIGRGEGQTVRLNFGDNSISRENHAAIAFDAEQHKFYFGHGGKANLVRLNNRPVLSTEELPSESEIRIGETTLRFVALCGEKFTWGADQQKVAINDVAG